MRRADSTALNADVCPRDRGGRGADEEERGLHRFLGRGVSAQCWQTGGGIQIEFVFGL